ncbi:MAG: sulfite exporter TauE/SafE family protein [Acidimicrobiia bacterium]
MPLGAGGWELAVAMAIVLLGGMVQGSIGFGLNLVVVPVLAVLIPGSVPGAMVLISMPMTLLMLLREHHAIDWVGVRWIAIGRLPGTFLGLLIVTALPDSQLAIIVGLVILLGVVASMVHPGIRVRPTSAAAIGSVAGVTGTAAGVDGPPLALLYQHAEPHTLRATLATCFLIGAAVSGTALALGGELTGDQLLLTAILLGPMLLGLALSSFVTHRIPATALRPIVLGFATVAGLVAIGRGLASR